MSSENLIEDILSAKDLIVVLENRYGDKYVESYQLPVIMLKNSKLWAKFGNVHSATGHSDMNESLVLSYAYNNFSDVVCTVGLNSFTQRFYSSYVYSSIKFQCRNSYQKIWSDKGVGDLSILDEAVRAGLKMKLVLKCDQGCSYIVPVHTLEVFKNKREFNLESIFDGFPEILRDHSLIESLGQDFKEALDKLTPPSYPGTAYNHNQKFFMMSFITDGTNVMQREFDENKQSIDKVFETKSIEIFAEVN